MDGDIHIRGILPGVEETTICTVSTCIHEDEGGMWLSKFVCINCVDVPKYLFDIVPKLETPPQGHSKTVTELPAAWKQSAVENEKQKVPRHNKQAEPPLRGDGEAC